MRFLAQKLEVKYMMDNNEHGAPVREGDTLKVKIEAIGDKGDGIAKKDGFVLVVPGTQQGQEVTIRVTKVLRKVGFAEVVDSDMSAESDESMEQDDMEETTEDLNDNMSSDDESSDQSEESSTDMSGETASDEMDNSSDEEIPDKSKDTTDF